jgi:DHA2 family multidrug resistance protein
MKKRETPTSKVPGDIWGIVWLVIGVTSLQILVDKGQDWDWWNSNLIRTLAVSTVIAFTYLIIREFTTRRPLMDLRLFSIPSFSLSIISLMVSYGIYFGTIVLVPLWLQEYMSYNAEWAGFAVCTLGIAPLFLTMSTPKIMKKIGFLKTLLISFFIFAIACFYTSFFTTDIDVLHIALSRFFFGIGFAFYINSMISLSVQDIPKEKLPSATGIFHFVRSMVTGVGTSVFTTLWIRRTIFHHERIGSALTPFNPMTPPVADPQSLALLNEAVDKQAAILAINEAFYLMAGLFLALIAVLIVWNAINKRSARIRPKVRQEHDVQTIGH